VERELERLNTSGLDSVSTSIRQNTRSESVRMITGTHRELDCHVHFAGEITIESFAEKFCITARTSPDESPSAERGDIVCKSCIC
jgi:hypothetical protein